jgi:4-amino-4-deoxy-L-arabinose transferase-like glycosyltransferase
MFAHFQTLVLLMLVVCSAMLISSIGLLRRRNWARLLFIGLLGLGIMYSIAALVLQQSMMSSFNASLPPDSTFRQTGQDFRQMLGAMRVVMFVVAIGFVGVFAWIIAKLVSPPIRQEFQSAHRTA